MILQGDLWKDTRGRVSNLGEVYAMGVAAQVKTATRLAPHRHRLPAADP